MAKEISSELLNTILTRVGGPGNIASCGNCMTRLRLGVHDSSLVESQYQNAGRREGRHFDQRPRCRSFLGLVKRIVPRKSE